MTQPEEIHQIEYRWEHQQDLVPIASSMPEHAKQSWNALISSWVRHPDAEVTAESVRYQVLPDGRAVLAWRYRYPEAANREDGTHGRPIVTRVFVAQPGLLTPDIAIVLCRKGMPESAGPLPGEVAHGELLPWLTVRELRSMTEDLTETMDREAAIAKGLTELLAVTLAEPELPLAIQLRLPYICDPPGSGPQPRLLWGMWRIGRPMLGDGGRGWSFSTFEAPLGDSDPARLPGIVFRLDQPVHHAPARARPERRVNPYDPGAPAALERYPEMAAWLVEEYRIRGGESLGGKLAEFSPGAPRGERFDAVDDWLRAVRRLPPRTASEREQSQAEPAASGQPELRPGQHPRMPSEMRAPDEQQERVGEDGHGDLEEAEEAFRPQDAEQPAAAAPPPPRRFRANEYQPAGYQTVTYTPPRYPEPAAAPEDDPAGQPAPPAYREQELRGLDQAAVAGYPPGPWQPQQSGADRAALQPLRTEPPPALPLADRPAGPPGGQPPEFGPGTVPVRPPQPARRPDPSRHVAKVSELLRGLTAAADAREFRSALDRVHRPPMSFDQSDRRQACHEMQDNNWYIPDLIRYNYVPCEHELAGIFRVILLDDLSLVQVRRQIAGWIMEAGERETRPLIRALLLAPRDDDTRKQMRELLRPALAARLMADYESADLWLSEPEPQEGESSGVSASGFRRLFSRGS